MGKRRKAKQAKTSADGQPVAPQTEKVVERVEETKMQIEGANGIKLDVVIESRTITP